tara:strand:- start:196 stop:498 length:303 start_codon:yes stop_codon:yes gene_type:complete
MYVAIIFIPVTIILIILLYYNKYNIRFFLPITLISIISGYITYKISTSFNDENKYTLIKLIFIIKFIIAMWCIEHNIIFKGFGIEKLMNYINNVLFIRKI